jgi:hypothetical protein
MYTRYQDLSHYVDNSNTLTLVLYWYFARNGHDATEGMGETVGFRLSL